MQRKLFIKRHLGVLAILGLFASIGIGLENSPSTYALTCDENSMVSCIDITFGDIVGGTDLKAPSPDSTSHGIDRAYFYLPVSLTIAHSSDYSIKVYSQNGGELRSSNGSIIPTLSGEAAKGTSLQDLGKDGSVWGYRSNLGDTAEDPTKNYLKVPSMSDSEANIVSGEQIDSTSGTVKKVLTLGFATAIDGNLPAGNYSDNIVVAITATPLQTTAFGTISTMQEMAPEICASATTPSKDAELSDATGIHHGDTRYVPEATLTDTRDGKEYLIRKLADGNCWMSQNLSLMLSPEETLTSEKTDLNSKTSWTPTTAMLTDAGVTWEKDDEIDRSASLNPDWYWTGGGTRDNAFSAVGNVAQGGAVGYAQRGNYYNWYAATAGSGKLNDVGTSSKGVGTTAAGEIAGTSRIIDGTVQDSICPRGWTLPVGGGTNVNSTDGSVKSFYNLIQVYTGVTGDISGVTAQTMYMFPLNFVPAGTYHYKLGTYDLPGAGQFYWSGTAAATSTDARSLSSAGGASITYPGAAGAKSLALSVRCVAR